MSDALFPSGQWIGFYTYPTRPQRFLMDLLLQFRDGAISGEGADGIGFFGIDGHYSAQDRECFWVKTYYGKHSVEYTGYREQKGIWGTWTIRQSKGGFHIWPIGEGAPLETLREQVEEEFPVRVGVPAMASPAVESTRSGRLHPVPNSRRFEAARLLAADVAKTD